MPTPSWIPFLTKLIKSAGTLLPSRTYLNFTGSGVTVTDDEANDQQTVTITAGGGSTPTGTGIPHIVAGVQNAAASLIVDADVNVAAAIAASKVVQATGTGFPHVTAGALDAASKKVDTTAAADVIVPATANGIVTSSGTVLQQAANVLAGSGYISIGASPAANGSIRWASVSSLRMLSSGGVNTVSIIEGDASDNVLVGTDSVFTAAKQAAEVKIYAGTAVHFGLGGNTYLYANGGVIESWVPRLGSASGASAYGSDGVGVQAMADANQTPAASVYKYGTIKTTGALTANRDLTLPTATDAGAYYKIINNTCTGAWSVNVKCAAGTAILVANGKTAVLLIDSRGVTRVTADV